jgi:hypothetical protein
MPNLPFMILIHLLSTIVTCDLKLIKSDKHVRKQFMPANQGLCKSNELFETMLLTDNVKYKCSTERFHSPSISEK